MYATLFSFDFRMMCGLDMLYTRFTLLILCINIGRAMMKLQCNYKEIIYNTYIHHIHLSPTL